MAYPIYPVEGTPYTNFHDLNLDWILGKVKEAYEAYKSIDSTIDKSVRAYMDSPEFIEALQDLISEEFITDTVIREIKQQLTVVNVADYGATGDGSDQTEALAAAFAAFNADESKTEIYFPAGSYRYTTGFSVSNRDIWLHGDHARIIPTRAIEGSDTINTFLRTSSGGRVKITGTVFRDYKNAAGSETPVLRTPQPLFSVNSPQELDFIDNHLADVVERRSTINTTAGPLWLEVTSNSGEIRFCNNEVTGDVGEMEIVTITSNTFTAGAVTCRGNRIHNCAMFGSILNVKGGVVFFNENFFENAAYPTTVRGNPGSLVNLLGYNVSAIGNIVVADAEHVAGNFIDTTEAGRYRASNTLISGNIIKAPIMASICDGSQELEMTGNEIYNTLGSALRTYIRSTSVEQTAESPVGKYGTLRVANNRIAYNPRTVPTGLGSGALYLGNLFQPDPRNQPLVWQYNYYDAIEICGNTFTLAGLPSTASEGAFYECAVPVRFMSIPNRMLVDGNVFDCSGCPQGVTTRLCYIDQARPNNGAALANNARTETAHFRIFNNVFRQTLAGTPATVYIGSVFKTDDVTYTMDSEGNNNVMVDACSLTPYLMPQTTVLYNNGLFHYQTT